MAVRQFGVWGIDVGQCALKAIRLEVKEGEVVATAFEYIEHPKILSQPDADPDELTREALNQFLSRNNIKGDLVAISVPGQSGLARFVKLPPVDEKKIADIVKFEAKQQIPFPLEEVVWDFQRLNRGDIVDGMALETEIGLFAMKRDMVIRSLTQFKDVSIEVQVVQMAPLALCNFVAYDLLNKDTNNAAEDTDDSHSCIVCLEIGTDSSNLVITDGGRIIWQRPIPIGGNHFTRALTKEMKLTFAKAEHLKRNASKSPDLKKILSSLKQVLNDFVGEVQRSLGYFTNTHRNAQIQYMIGLGNAFRLPGLQKFLQEKLQLEVRKLQKLERATGESVTAAPTFAENIMSFGVAYGLGLQGLKQARLQTNLLPYEVRMERMIRGKKPWVVTAAASLLVGMFMLAFARGMEQKAVVNDELDRGMAQLTKDKKEVEANTLALKTQEDLLLKKIGTLDKIGAGVNQRMNWQLLHQYINMSTPQPNGDRLVSVSLGIKHVKKDYWDNDEKAQKAYQFLEEKRFGKLANSDPAKNKEKDLFIKKHLIQINIAGINALYSDDLPSYFRKITNDGNGLLGMDLADKQRVQDFVAENDPEKRKKLVQLLPKEGWVVEVRGYTYHHGGLVFVNNTIIENLKNPAGLKDPAQKVKEVKERVAYLTTYRQNTVSDPVAGQFEIIGTSYLKTLIKGTPELADLNAEKVVLTPVGGVGQAEQKISRDGWRPLGEVASAIFVDNAGGVAPAPAPIAKGPFDPKAAPPDPVVPRYEFVVLFVWQESISAQQTISLVEKKN